MLHYKVIGSGKRTLVCLHGFLESSEMWRDLQLEENARLLLIDLPGHGKSGLNGIDSMKETALEVLKIIKYEEVVGYDILGHSMGGYVGLELKQMDANSQKLILLNSNMWADSRQKKLDRQRVAKLVQTKKDRFISEAIPNLFQDPELHSTNVSQLVSDALTMEAEAISKASLAMSERMDYSEAVFSGQMKVMVIQGVYDTVVDADKMKKIMTNHPNNYFLVETGHMAHIELREEIVALLSEILQN